MGNIQLFNVNGHVGYGTHEIQEFPYLSDLISHLDYLEIDRSLIWHTEARDVNPARGNRRLLKEIAESSYGDRLIPAFVITPACYYEYGTMEFLKENLVSSRVRALRIIPDASRFEIREIEQILMELTDFKPLILWDCPTFHSEFHIRDFEYLAQKFPAINFAITQKMWPGFGSVLDLMWRQPNIYIDISWLHMRDTIEFLTDNFGAERVLFGIGHKSHYGAAVAALAHAQIKPEEKELIAHGNIERLLKLKPLSEKLSSSPNILNNKALWKRFRSGLPVENVRIIDAHSHIGPHTRGWFIRDNDPEQYIQALIRQMDRLGICKMLICPTLHGNAIEENRNLAEVIKKYYSRFSGYLSFNPFYGNEIISEVDKFFADGFYIGFKILPSYWKFPVTDPGYIPMWQYANKYNLPVLIHTWDDSYNSPAMLKDIVKEYPDATFLLGHSGGGCCGRTEAEELVIENPNVILEFCGSFTTPILFEESMKKAGVNQVVFGSDTGAHCQAWELGRFLSMPLPDEELIPGLSANIEHILAKSKLITKGD
jgi:predicted TIM-barrel fold metal-dependent hydrolase